MSAPSLPIRRNTVLLAGLLAAVSGWLQLIVAVMTLTFVLVTGIEGLLGLGPALFLTAGGLAALPAGRAMDRFGRVPVLAAGCCLGIAGSAVTALGVHLLSGVAVVLGFTLAGAASGTLLLTRTAAGDMYPAARRARGIAYVLVGSVAGAILGPFVFGPLFSGKHVEAAALVVPWLASGGFLLVGLVLVLCVRPDPRRIADLIAEQSEEEEEDEPVAPAAPLRVLLRRPGVARALVAGVASFSVMASVMNLTGYVVVGHGHQHQAVFPILAAHVLGMFGLVLVVGNLIDRIGRALSIGGGLLVMSVSVVSLLWIESVPATALALFGLGLGWNFSFVAATADLADRTASVERGKVLGLNDLLSSLLAAGLALLGGYALSLVGVAALAIGGTAIVAVPALFILRRRGRPAVPAPAATLRSR